MPVVNDAARGFRQGCRRDLGFASGRVPLPYPERRDSGRGFSSASINSAPWTAKAIVSRDFHGVPAAKKSIFDSSVGPAHILLYQKNIEAVCSNEAEVRHQIRQTFMHELGQYFGMTEEQLTGV